VLDVGCGTGDDCRHLVARGVRVVGIDESPEMVRIARSRHVEALVLRADALPALDGPFDGAISNFGVLNCVERLARVGEQLAGLVLPGGFLILGTLGRVCLWEIVWYLGALRPARAFRRLRGQSISRSLGIRVYYHSVRAIARAFSPSFRLLGWQGLGLAVPPSYVSLPEEVVSRLADFDAHAAQLPLLRALADHRLLVFQRI
jgi:SAM-dependent methyltransferase